MPRTKGTIRKDAYAEMIKHSPKLWTPHVANGAIYCVSRSAIPPTREEIIAGVLAVKVQVFKTVNGKSVPDGPARFPTRAEAERYVPLIRSETAA